ncbi:MAG TPA: prolyl oligopeptidase family serine peptidase [Puia sp.]|nr:prolyl oligopeptidase family serine peptidase [Puia sp.]
MVASKRITLLILSILTTTILFAQKQPVDTTSFFHWPAIDKSSAAISNDGKYVLYSINNQPAGNNTLMIQALSGNWKIALPGVDGGVFTKDSREVVFFRSNDSLCLLTLGTNDNKYIPQVRSFKLFIQGGEEWMAYQLNNPEKGLTVQNISTGKEQTYENADRYFLSSNGKILVLLNTEQTAEDKKTVVKWIDLITNKSNVIGKGADVKNLVIDANGTQLTFIRQERDGNVTKNTIWYYKVGMDKAVEVEEKLIAGLDQNLEVGGISGFTRDGNRLFINLKEKALPQPKTNAVKVDVWSYTDAKLQSQQLSELGDHRSYLAVVVLGKPMRLLRIQQENETISVGNGSTNDDFAIVTSRLGEAGEYYWSKAALGTTFVVSTVTGERKKLSMLRARLSTEGKYVIGYGPGESMQDIYSYEMATGITRNMTDSLAIPSYTKYWDRPVTLHYRGLLMGPWLADDAATLIYDDYDIWEIDPSCKKAPINLTNGRIRNLRFRVTSESLKGAIHPNDIVLLQAFNKESKQSGFYQLRLAPSVRAELLYMGDYIFAELPNIQSPLYPLKARNANVYIVNRERVNESPNIFYTTDFKTYYPISNVYPEKNVSWFNSELIDFKTSDGIHTKAILYKPEGFNPQNKYPLIIHYYEKKSDELNKYWAPVIDNGGELDIAWFGSHGYLVLLTDIHYKIGYTGESVYKSVVGAAQYISNFPWVDKSHIGIQGHSFGGYETNYLVTHSSLFAAAVSSSGVSDLTSASGSLGGKSSSTQEYYETRDGRMGTTPWAGTDIYVKNSPVFYIGNVVTPILLINNKNDGNVPFEQGLEFFTGLRRAGKRVWMLQYDNGGHGIGGDDYKDYIIRSAQFFDHYLKGAPAPKWMTRGIPASEKGLEDGLELDRDIKTPGPGLLIEEERKKGQLSRLSP